MKKQLDPSGAIFPVSAALIASGAKDNADIAIAWIGIASSTHPTIGISLKKRRHSLKLIRNTIEFSVNIPTSSIYKEIDYCGIPQRKNMTA